MATSGNKAALDTNNGSVNQKSNRILGELEKDWLYGSKKADIIEGLSGDDIIRGDDGDDLLSGGAGEDSIAGGIGSDFLFGGTGDDSLQGNDGDDVLIGGKGDDRLFGGEGKDTYIYESGYDKISDFNPDEDLIDVSELHASDFESLLEGAIENSHGTTFNFGDGNALFLKDVSISELSADNFVLSASSEKVVATEVLNYLASDDCASSILQRSNRILGELEKDWLYGSKKADIIEGLSGDDIIRGDDGDDFLSGGAGEDSIAGGIGSDFLLGGTGDDSLQGNDGDDVLIGGKGDDRLFGGEGKDTYIYESGYDKISDFNPDEDLIDVSELHASDFESLLEGAIENSHGTTFNFGDGNALFLKDVSISELSADNFVLSASSEKVVATEVLNYLASDDCVSSILQRSNRILGELEKDWLYGSKKADIIEGLSGDDIIRGDDGDDLLSGGAGEDSIAGGIGSDFLLGGTGDDSLQGNDGDDVLIGGKGDDRLFGGEGKDTYIYESGYDKISDFNPDEDLIDVSELHASDFESLLEGAIENSHGTTFNFGDGNALFLKDVSISELSADNFVLSASSEKVVATEVLNYLANHVDEVPSKDSPEHDVDDMDHGYDEGMPTEDHAGHDVDKMGDGHHDDMPAIELPETPEEIEVFVAAVKVTPESHAHGDHSQKMSEHLAAMELVDRAEATHIAIGSGDWNDPTNWYEGRIPDADARALIPEGVQLSYGDVNDARLFTLRVDGELNFATDVDSRLVLDTFVVSPSGKLTIGTKEEPVQADVNVEIVFANNGAIDTTWDPMLLSRGMITHGKVEIHGAEKDSHEKVIEDPMAGDTSIMFEEVPAGWQIGDTIIIAGTHYEGFYNWDPSVGYELSEDEERVITAIEGDTVYFDTPLIHNHDAPRDDLKTSVANYTRNVSFETEDAIHAEVYERGHVMFMHNDDVEVRYAEFHELGRTDKSEDAFDLSALDELNFDSNVQGRYSLHLHRTGTADQDNPAIVEGNAVYGSPGWGYVHHDSHAILTNNASFNTFGAGYVAESGNETGAWHDNIAILAQGTAWSEPKGINVHPDRFDLFDLGRSGDGFWFQSRMVESTDNVAASVHNGFVYFSRGPVGGEGKVGSLNFDADTTALSSAFHYDDDNFIDRYPILSFSGNETFAAKSGLYILKAWFTQDHGIYSVLEDFTAWSVRDGVDMSYTGHYILKDFDLISRGGSDLRTDLGTGIKLGNNIIDIKIVDANIEGFTDGIDLSKVLKNLPLEHQEFTVINPTFIDVETEYKNYDPILDTILDHGDLPNLTPDIILDGPLYYDHNPANVTETGRWVEITGTKTDTLGETKFSDGPDTFRLSGEDVRNIMREQGYYTTSDGEQYFVLDIFFSDRVTGEIYVEKHPVFVDENANLNAPNHLWFEGVTHNGVLDLGGPQDPTSDVAKLWATVTDGQMILSEDMLPLPEENFMDMHNEDLFGTSL